MLKALNIIALVFVIVSASVSCANIPMRGQFRHAYGVEGTCVLKAKHYAYNLWAAGYEPYLAIVDQKHPSGSLHMLVTLDSVTYYDPSTLRVHGSDKAGVIKLIYKFKPEGDSCD